MRRLLLRWPRVFVRCFAPDDAEMREIARLVSLLDGLPLAIELAAARVRILAPAEQIERFEGRFGWLTHDPSVLRPRRATLWETIEASWAVLAPWEREALSQVSTFRGGFGVPAAESVLGIGRSAISQQMSDLEQRLGLRLCQRGRAGFALTEEGREVYQSSMQLLAALETFRTEVNGLHQHLRGELNIGLTDNLVTLPHMRITHALSRLKERGPDVQINIRMTPPSEVEQGVLDGRLHVFLRLVPEQPEQRLRRERLGRCEDQRLDDRLELGGRRRRRRRLGRHRLWCRLGDL